jgi:hypothetical protein
LRGTLTPLRAAISYGRWCARFCSNQPPAATTKAEATRFLVAIDQVISSTLGKRLLECYDLALVAPLDQRAEMTIPRRHGVLHRVRVF